MDSIRIGNTGDQLAFSLSLEEKDLYSLDRFYEGDFNKVPLGVAKLFGKSGSGDRLPKSLVITGDKGAGKSHLLKGLYQRFLSEEPNAKVAILNAEELLSVGNVVGRFKQLYDYDLVCIDSLDGVKGDEGFYEAVFNLFNELVGHGAYLAFAMRRSPAKVKGMPDYLYTRLLSGMVVTIKRAGDAERGRILMKLSADRQVALAPRGVKYILEHSGRSVGSLVNLIRGLEKELGKKGGKASLQLIKSVINSI